MSWEVQKVREEEEDIMLPVGGSVCESGTNSLRKHS